MSEARDRQELLAQMAAFCDGVATPEEVARLEERLRDDAAARRAFCNYVDLNVDLYQQQNRQPANELASLLAVAQEDAAARLAGRPPPWFSRPFYFWSFVTVLTLLIWAAMLGWTSRQ